MGWRFPGAGALLRQWYSGVRGLTVPECAHLLWRAGFHPCPSPLALAQALDDFERTDIWPFEPAFITFQQFLTVARNVVKDHDREPPLLNAIGAIMAHEVTRHLGLP